MSAAASIFAARNPRGSIGGWRVLWALACATTLAGCTPGSHLASDALLGRNIAVSAQASPTVMAGDPITVRIHVDCTVNRDAVQFNWIDANGQLLTGDLDLDGVHLPKPTSTVCDSPVSNNPALFFTDLTVTGSVASSAAPGQREIRLRATLPAATFLVSSLEVSTTSFTFDVVAANAPPAATQLLAVPTETSVQLSWQAPTNSLRQRIERASAGAAFVPLADVSATTADYNDTGLPAATAYVYRVIATNAAGDGPAATVNTVTLSPSGVPLTVVVPAGGRINTQPPGIDCIGPNTCVGYFAFNTTVTLQNTPTPGWRFARYNGDVVCVGGVIELSQPTQCGAVFDLLVPVGVWAQVGNALQPSNAQSPALVIDTLDQPTIAYTVTVAGGLRELYVERFDRGANPPRWFRYGSAALNSGFGSASAVSMVMAPGNRPVLAWNNSGNVQVSAWVGSRFAILSPTLNVSGAAGPIIDPRVSVAGNVVTAAWIEVTNASTEQRIALKRYDSAAAAPAWSGGFVTTETRAMGLQMAQDALGRAHLLVFTAGAPGADGPVHLWREDPSAGGGWLQLCGDVPFPGSREFASNNAKGAGLVFSGADPVAVVNDGKRVFALRCDGSSWQGLGSGTGEIAADVTDESIAAVTVPRGDYTQPLVAVAHYVSASRVTTRIDIQRWNGLSWLPAGGPYSSDRNVALNQLALAGSPEQPQLGLADAANSSSTPGISVWQWVP